VFEPEERTGALRVDATTAGTLAVTVMVGTSSVTLGGLEPQELVDLGHALVRLGSRAGPDAVRDARAREAAAELRGGPSIIDSRGRARRL
jgi:hypothetical protein